MLRATSVIPSTELGGQQPFDRVELPHDGRLHRRATMRTEGDVVFRLDLAETQRLRDGDGLLLEDGRIVGVAAAEEPVIEISAASPEALARIAWHLGSHHVPAQFAAGGLRIAPDPNAEALAQGLGGTLSQADAPFEPEGAACGHDACDHHAGHGHHHHHHGHDHHHHHDHGHHHGHHHDHGHSYDHHGHGSGRHDLKS